MCSRDLFAAVPAQLFLLVVDYLGTEAVEVVVSILGRDGEVRNQQFVHTHGCVGGHYLTELGNRESVCWDNCRAVVGWLASDGCPAASAVLKVPPLSVKYHETLGDHGVVQESADIPVDTWLVFQRRCVSFGR